MDKNMISQFIKYLLGPSLYNREIEDSKQAEETHKHVLIFFLCWHDTKVLEKYSFMKCKK